MSVNRDMPGEAGPTSLEIAVIGMAGRFPGSSNLEDFWQHLCRGEECITRFSEAELLASGVAPELLSNPRYVRARAILDDIALFDAASFGLLPREAELLDPQRRIFLECAWHALEDAGYDSWRWGGAIGVFAGSSLGTYLIHNLYHNRKLVDTTGVFSLLLGNSRDFLATDVAYRLNLTGPAVVVQSACSTSLVAVHLACQSLLSGESDMALAGGVSITVPQQVGYLYQEGGIHSPDGHVRVFDWRAQGTVSGEGAGVVVLKRLADALADRDTIRAVIRGSAMNNDGAAKLGYTAPSVSGQAGVIRAAQALAAVDPATITYVEAHGTGTRLGDPMEVAALAEAFRERTRQRQFCALGSVKANIGHLDSAAGIAGLIKVLLMLEHGLLPPSPNFERANPEINFDDSPFYVNTRLHPWVTSGTPRRAGVSSFGVGGTNVHVVLESAPPQPPPAPARSVQILTLSARTETALEALRQGLSGYLHARPEAQLADVAYTLQLGRRLWRHRFVAVAHDHAEALAALAGGGQSSTAQGCAPEQPPAVVFLFPGAGAQYPGMGRELYDSEPVYREQVRACLKLLDPGLAAQVALCLRPEPGQQAEAAMLLQQPGPGLLALFITEYALARLWLAWGVEPQALFGHSLGEYVAACLSGVMALPDALRVVAARARIFTATKPGAMLVVHLSEDELRRMLDAELDTAAVNGARLCVISGTLEAIEHLEGALLARGVFHQRLQTNYAGHSRLLNEHLDAFATFMSTIPLHPPVRPFVSCLTGDWALPEQVTTPTYWAQQMRQTVRFADGVARLRQCPSMVFLEVGPGQTLGKLVSSQNAESDHKVLASLPSHRAETTAAATAALALGQLWLQGVMPGWEAIHGPGRARVPLPGYPFERQRFWIDSSSGAAVNDVHRGPPGKGDDLAAWFWLPTWRRQLPLGQRRTGAVAGEGRCCLIFVDGCGVGHQLAQGLAAAGDDVVTVMAGQQFSCLGDTAYTISPSAPGDYRGLLQALDSQGRAPNVIVHCWAVTSDQDRGTGMAHFEAMQTVGFYSLMFLTQALAHSGDHTPVQLTVIANRLQNVSGADVSDPAKATLLGLCKVIPQEHPDLACRCIDICLAPPGSDEEQRTIGQLLVELDGEAVSPIVAYRGSQPWAQDFDPIALGPAATPPWRERGVYLIAGGLGRVGLLVAEHLWRRARARLVLIGRSTLPPRAEWEAWQASHGDRDRTGRILRRLLALEALGAEVLIVTANVADSSQMRAVMSQIDERFGELNGVIYAASVHGPGTTAPISALGQSDARDQFEPKVAGLYVLDELVRERQIDVCMLFSSIATMLGGLGLATYSAANHFMDAFATARAPGRQRPWVSVSWDIWPNDDEGEAQLLRTSIDRYAMSRAEALDALDRVMAAGPCQHMLVSTGDLRARARLWAGGERQTALPAQVVMSPTGGRVGVTAPYEPARNAIEQQVVDVWEAFLGITPLGIHDDFFELGGHSLIAVQILSRLQESFGVTLPLNLFFEGPTVASLSLAIVQQRAQQVDAETLRVLLAELELSSTDEH